MPPIYQWRCDACDALVDVMRTMADSAVQPTEGELAEADTPPTCSTDTGRHAWLRALAATPTIRGASWGVKKRLQ